jgi:hypothetical protein
LGKREADRGVDAYTAISRFFDGGKTGPGHRDLYDDIGRQLRKLDRLFNNGVGIPIKPRISLNRQPAIFALLLSEDGLEEPSRFHRDFPHNLPSDLILGGSRHFVNQSPNPVSPGSHFLLKHTNNDDRLRR